MRSAPMPPSSQDRRRSRPAIHTPTGRAREARIRRTRERVLTMSELSDHRLPPGASRPACERR